MLILLGERPRRLCAAGVPVAGLTVETASRLLGSAGGDDVMRPDAQTSKAGAWSDGVAGGGRGPSRVEHAGLRPPRRRRRTGSGRPGAPLLAAAHARARRQPAVAGRTETGPVTCRRSTTPATGAALPPFRS